MKLSIGPAVIAVLLVGCGNQAASTSTSSTTAPSTTTVSSEVRVFFSTGNPTDCGRVLASTRAVPSDEDPIEFALNALLAGPTEAERSDGSGSMFGSGTVGLLRSVQLQGDTLMVDFEDFSHIIPNASTSCGSQAMTAQLNGTVFQFDEVKRVVYMFNGSCDAFGEFIQTGCVEFTSPDL